MGSEQVRRFILIILRTGALLLFLFPSLWMILGSLWPDYTLSTDLFRFDRDLRLTLANYVTASTLVPLGRFSLNSLVVVLVAVPLSLFVASSAAFAMARHRLFGSDLLVTLSLMALIAPPTALWLARFPLFRAAGLLDSLWALIAPALLGGSPFFVLLFYWSFRRISAELWEAAELDGADPWRLWWFVALPAIRPIFLVAAVLIFALFWGNFTDPLLYLRSRDLLTLPIGVQLLAQLDSTRLPLLLSGATIVTAPILILFLVGTFVFRGRAVPGGEGRGEERRRGLFARPRT